MGLLSEQKQQVQEKVSDVPIEPQRDPSQPGDISRVEPNIVKETPIEPFFEPIQIVETVNRVATGNLVTQDTGVKIVVVPKISKEVYSIDILDSNNKLVYAVNAHSGRFESNVPLPKGQYFYFIKTQRDDMPFSVTFE